MTTTDGLETVATGVGLVAVLVAAGFVVVRGRRIARLERAVAASISIVEPLPESRQRELAAATPMPLGRRPGRGRIQAVVLVAVIGVLAVAGGLVWIAIGRSTTKHAQTPAAVSAGLGADPQTAVPARLPALGNLASYTVAVLNAASPSAPLATQTAASVSAAGYSVGTVGNAPTFSLAQSVVMWEPGQQLLAEHVARSMRIMVVEPLDGLTTQEVGGAQAVVLIGRDRLRS
jgi:hypothetical protein